MLNVTYTEIPSACDCEACDGALGRFADPADCTRLEVYRCALEQMDASLPTIAHKVGPLVLTEQGACVETVTVITAHEDFDPWDLFGDCSIDEIQQVPRSIDITIEDSGRGTLTVGARHFTLGPISSDLAHLCAKVGGPAPAWSMGLSDRDTSFLLDVANAADLNLAPISGGHRTMRVVAAAGHRTSAWRALRSVLEFTPARRARLIDLLEDDPCLEDAAAEVTTTPPTS